ncbi:MAG: glycogen/starch synthase [Desulfobacterales bacterium]
MPRILFITPELIFFLNATAADNKVYSSRRGKKIEFFAGLLDDLYQAGFDIQIAQPAYRKLFSFLTASDHRSHRSDIPADRLHLLRDRVFYYADDIDVNRDCDNIKICLAFQREIINHLVPMIQPDLLHCHDWMAGLIPAAARQLSIPCLFTVYDIRSKKIPLWRAEDMGIDMAYFWEDLFYDRMPTYYEETRETNLVDLLLSGVYAADLVDAASLGAMSEILFCQSRKEHNKTIFRQLLAEKFKSGSISCCNCTDASNSREYIDLYERLLSDFATEPAGQ